MYLEYCVKKFPIFRDRNVSLFLERKISVTKNRALDVGVVSSMRLTSYFHHERIFSIRFNSSSAKFSVKNYTFYPYNLFYREIIRP